jgi:nucleoside triphosphatase
MTDQLYPEPTVGAFIFNPKGELLLLRSHKWPGSYTIPGGHVELGERLEQAVVREAKEETGLDVYDIALINFQEFVYDPAFWKPRHFIFFDFACKTGGAEVKLNDEAQEYLWAEPRQALALELDAYTRRSVEVYLEKPS